MDGFVYVGAESGTVFKGRNHEWQLIERGYLTLPFEDMVWFQDRVWCTSDYGLWVIEDDTVEYADVPPEVKVCSRSLSVSDNIMLLAGFGGAAFHDGKAWQVIFNTIEMEAKLRKS